MTKKVEASGHLNNDRLVVIKQFQCGNSDTTFIALFVWKHNNFGAMVGGSLYLHNGSEFKLALALVVSPNCISDILYMIAQYNGMQSKCMKSFSMNHG